MAITFIFDLIILFISGALLWSNTDAIRHYNAEFLDEEREYVLYSYLNKMGHTNMSTN